jgi:hypothetical protein
MFEIKKNVLDFRRYGIRNRHARSAEFPILLQSGRTEIITGVFECSRKQAQSAMVDRDRDIACFRHFWSMADQAEPGDICHCVDVELQGFQKPSGSIATWHLRLLGRDWALPRFNAVVIRPVPSGLVRKTRLSGFAPLFY